jgi:hypothetical protein
MQLNFIKKNNVAIIVIKELLRQTLRGYFLVVKNNWSLSLYICSLNFVLLHRHKTPYCFHFV